MRELKEREEHGKRWKEMGGKGRKGEGCKSERVGEQELKECKGW